MALPAKKDAGRVENVGGGTCIGEVNAGAVSAFEERQLCRIAQGACNQSPPALQMTGDQLIQRSGRVLTGQRG